ncbi:MAG: glycoside hydrolase family 97 C-terminal domain-containing protein, partial [Bacteroidales bacterium]|nr:glycoside hydrolase family 97 C-terminal domain-containing protein [Bacteroidales bacterium]
YLGHPALQFIKDVPVDWEQTKVLDAKIGKYITVARKDRDSKSWFIGAATNEEGRTSSIDCSFLDKGCQYEAIIYKDGDAAHWKTNPKEYEILTQYVNSGDVLKLNMAPGGGLAISLKPVK